MDQTPLIDRICATPVSMSLSPAARPHVAALLRYWQTHHAARPPAQLAYILATVLAEVGPDMAPVRETFARDDAEARARLAEKPYAQPCGPCGEAYYGRGYVQLTWLENYARQGDRLDLPLVETPDLALLPEVAVRVLVEGMLDGDFHPEGLGLAHYIDAARQDFIGARNTVNLQNRASDIARDAEAFLHVLLTNAAETGGD
ncbi:hypothetical protein [Oceanibium sediminis]|uniref:hypothetical protein n=1 Tax=Oceanibium sediminis TaxID=2026339 RepID=UPI0013006DF8|nr:hypothetical protein [Oceanibium sediminis]